MQLSGFDVQQRRRKRPQVLNRSIIVSARLHNAIIARIGRARGRSALQYRAAARRDKSEGESMCAGLLEVGQQNRAFVQHELPVLTHERPEVARITASSLPVHPLGSGAALPSVNHATDVGKS